MSDALGDLNRHIDDFEQQLQTSSARIEQARAIGESLKDVRGTADSEDGHIHVEWSARGLAELELNPRAMRMPSEDLATAIKQTIADAVADYQAATMAAMRESGLLATADEQRAELDRAVGRLGSAQADFAASLRSAAQAVAHASSVRRPQG